MRKLIVALMIALFLSACQNEAQILQEKYERYKLHYQSILNTTQFKTSSEHFSIEASLVKLSDGQYRYDVFVDEPKIAMHDVEILAIVDNGLLLVSDKMMPSVGLFEDESYRLIPYQVDVELGYHKGFNLNGIVESDKINLKVVVMWKDYFEIKTEREYFSFDLSVEETVDE